MSIIRKVLLSNTKPFQYQKCVFERCLKRGLSVDVNSLKKGMVIEVDNKFWSVQSRDHSNTGRGSARIKVELAQVGADRRKVESFRPGETFEVLKLKHKKYQFLYQDGSNVHLLEPETLEELTLSFDYFTGDKKHTPFLEGGMEILVDSTEDDKIVCFRLPATYTYKVASIASGGGSIRHKGVSITTATLENGVYLTVPDFIKSGDKIIVDLDTLKYSSRAYIQDFRLNINRKYHQRKATSTEPFLPLREEDYKESDFTPKINNLLKSSQQELEDYLKDLNKGANTSEHQNTEKVFKAIFRDTTRQFAGRAANKMVSETLGKYLYHLVRTIKPNRVLEIGTFAGYSTNWILYGMAEEEYTSILSKKFPTPFIPGNLTKPQHFTNNLFFLKPLLLTCDIDREALEIASHYLDFFKPISVSINPVFINSQKLLQEIPEKTHFDFIFVDGAKKNYKDIYDAVISKELLSPSGLMVFDNVLFKGDVASFHDLKVSSDPNDFRLKKAKSFSTSKSLYDFNKFVANDKRSQSIFLPVFDGLCLVQRNVKFLRS